MEYKGIEDRLRELAKIIGSSGKGWGPYAGVCRQAATAFTDLLATARAAEARVETLETANKILSVRITEVEAALKIEKSYDTPLPPFDEDDPDGTLYCQKCGSGEYLESKDGDRNNYCGQCGQRIDWDAWDATQKEGRE